MAKETRVNINGLYVDPTIEYNINKIYNCAPQAGIHGDDEALGIPLRATAGMTIIYDSQHMLYKSIVFCSIFDKNGRAWPALKCVLAPADGSLRMVKGKPAMDTRFGLLMFEGLSKPRLGSRKKGEVIGEVSSQPQIKGVDGIMLTCYKAIDGEVFYLPSAYYGIQYLE